MLNDTMKRQEPLSILPSQDHDNPRCRLEIILLRAEMKVHVCHVKETSNGYQQHDQHGSTTTVELQVPRSVSNSWRS